ncbi:hypothetical protein N7448_010060 [Penicillium atrosanguineum]|nr:hypothetical protein N7448_010060 [Penicillium atrosanguineum]
MSDRESASLASKKRNGEEDYDKPSGQSKERHDQHLGNKYDDCSIHREVRDPSTPRIRWRANSKSMQDIARAPPREDIRTEWDKTQKEGQSHRPTMPYAHESTDIADEPRRPQQYSPVSQQTENIAPDEQAPPGTAIRK